SDRALLVEGREQHDDRSGHGQTGGSYTTGELATANYNSQVLGRARVVGFVVTLAIVAYGVWRLDLSKVGAALGTANYAVLPLSALATFCSYLLRAARWQRILGPTGWIPFRTLYAPLMIGFMAN